jgi:hypothetical protein
VLLNSTNQKQFELLLQRTDLPDVYVKSINNAKLFAEYAEDFFIRDSSNSYDFFESCDRALIKLSDELKNNGDKLDFNAIIPPVYKFWLYNHEFEGWLKDVDEDDFVLINI